MQRLPLSMAVKRESIKLVTWCKMFSLSTGLSNIIGKTFSIMLHWDLHIYESLLSHLSCIKLQIAHPKSETSSKPFLLFPIHNISCSIHCTFFQLLLPRKNIIIIEKKLCLERTVLKTQKLKHVTKLVFYSRLYCWLIVFPRSIFLPSNPSFPKLGLAFISLPLVKLFLTDNDLGSITELHDNSTLEYPLPNMW